VTVLSALHQHNLGTSNAAALVAIHKYPDSTPAELQLKLKQHGVDLSRNSVYQCVSRLFERKYITQTGKRPRQDWRQVLPSYRTTKAGNCIAQQLAK
jgi:zona occludens toxin (predicted ATPase)